ncbi:hypothetical protein Tco_0723751 [Tanacetum coccineum]
MEVASPDGPNESMKAFSNSLIVSLLGKSLRFYCSLGTKPPFEVKHAQSEEVQELLSKLVQDSSVENLVPTPIEFEDFSDDECDLPPYDDSSKNHDFTFSNPLFDIDEDFTLSDESFSEEDIPKENFIIFSNPLFDLDEEIASTKVDRINDEVLESIHSIPPGIDSFDAESDLVESMLNREGPQHPPPKNLNQLRLILLLRSILFQVKFAGELIFLHQFHQKLRK